MEIDHLFIFFCHDRDKVLAQCLNSFGNSFDWNFPKNTKLLFYLDYPTEKVATIVQSFLKKINSLGREDITVGAIGSWHNNYGYSYHFYEAYLHTKRVNPKYVFFIETDYVFRKNFYDDCIYVLNDTLSIGVPGTSHPDFLNKEKCIKMFSEVMNKQFGEDVTNRHAIYNPFFVEGGERISRVQYGTHSCCCFMLAWQKLLRIVDVSDLDELLARGTEKATGFVPITPNDGMITGGISLLFDKSTKSTKHPGVSAFIDIVSAPIAIHIAGQGINSKYAPENVAPEPPVYWDWSLVDLTDNLA